MAKQFFRVLSKAVYVDVRGTLTEFVRGKEYKSDGFPEGSLSALENATDAGGAKPVPAVEFYDESKSKTEKKGA